MTIGSTLAGATSGRSSLERMAEELFNESSTLRRRLNRQSRDFLRNGMDPMATPEFAAIRHYADTQANQARDSILETMPGGGTLLDKLADVDIGKARTLTDAAGGIYGDNLNRAMTLATGGTQGALTAMSGAEQLRAAQEQANADRDSASKGAMGTVAGGMLGGPMGASMASGK